MRARIGIVAPILLMLGTWSASVPAADWNYRIGEKAPAFSLKTLDGKPAASADFKGHYTVVSFMTTWCPFCNAAAPHLQKIGNDYRERGVKVLVVDIEEEDKVVKKRVAKHGLTCAVLMDRDGMVATAYAPPKDFVPDLARQEVMIASFAIVDPEGTVRFLTLNEKPEEFDAKLTKLRMQLDEFLATK